MNIVVGMMSQEGYEEFDWNDLPGYVEPPHEVRDRTKLNHLVDSFRKNGWLLGERSLLLVNMGETYQALTGSHRIAALNILAKKGEAPDDVDVYILDGDDLESAAHRFDKRDHGNTYSKSEHENETEFLMSLDDDDKVSRLRDLGFQEAAKIMKQEVGGG
jgi:hypothetical protein